MLKEVRVLLDMLLNLVERRYFYCFLLLCYVASAFLAAFFFHSFTAMTSSVTKPRYIRSLSSYEQCAHPCDKCPSEKFKFIDVRGIPLCRESCPENHHPRTSSIEGSTCVRCTDPNCSACKISPSHCNECTSKHVLHGGSCLVKCPIKLFRHKRKCFEKCPNKYKKNRRKRACVLKRGYCHFTQWIPTSKCHCHNHTMVRIFRREILRGTQCKGKVKKTRRCKNTRSCAGFSSNLPRRNKPNNKQTNNSRRRNDVTKTRTRNNKNQIKHRTS